MRPDVFLTCALVILLLATCACIVGFIKTRRWGWLVGAVLVAIAAAQVASNVIWMTCTTLPAYRGDGEFHDLTGRSLGPAFSIHMPKFDLGQPFEAKYHATGLKRVGWDCALYLATEPIPDRVWADIDRLGGHLSLDLIDSRGAPLVNVGGKLGEFGWTADFEHVEFAKFPACRFEPDPNEQYVIRVSYSPDPRLKGLKGYVYIRSGGRK